MMISIAIMLFLGAAVFGTLGYRLRDAGQLTVVGSGRMVEIPLDDAQMRAIDHAYGPGSMLSMSPAGQQYYGEVKAAYRNRQKGTRFLYLALALGVAGIVVSALTRSPPPKSS